VQPACEHIKAFLVRLSEHQHPGVDHRRELCYRDRRVRWRRGAAESEKAVHLDVRLGLAHRRGGLMARQPDDMAEWLRLGAFPEERRAAAPGPKAQGAGSMADSAALMKARQQGAVRLESMDAVERRAALRCSTGL
jgi:hypothetical protein